ncbi:E3 ubiquitin/ISG15 ligase TRIM25 [Betta splendens]|uniref:E3 ubiquitin/ISG15 ligase TRIM25 n=1 Tax=Betta splendens TaxID=158456 RepID=A0A6P7MGN0_BETSP|nr:E3 ubiquitin/ISG15 ligase TRIM25 [Betta splendens]
MSVSDGEDAFPSHSGPDPLALQPTCPICLQLFSRPVSLPCGHVYCLGCLQTMGEGLDQHRCPECHAQYRDRDLVERCRAPRAVEAAERSERPDATPKQGAAAAEPRARPKVEMDEPKFRLASEVTELTLRLEMAEAALKKEKQWEVEVAAANAQLRERTSGLLQQMKGLSESYSTRMVQMVEEELGPGEAGVRGRVRQASELTRQLRRAVLRAESLLTEDDGAAFADELRTLQPDIQALLAKPLGDEREPMESRVNPARACSKLEDMNAELRERLGEIQRSLRSTLNPSEVTFDPETAHPNLVLSEDLKTVTFSAAKQPYPSRPQRFTSFFQVLSAQSFSEGDHSWEVELDGSPWIVGVCHGSQVPRSGLPSALESSRGSWCLMWFNNRLTAFERGHDVPLKRTTVSRRLEMRLSFKTHRLSFYDISPVSGKTHVYTFKANLTEPVHLAYRMMSGHPKARVTIYS